MRCKEEHDHLVYNSTVHNIILHNKVSKKQAIFGNSEFIDELIPNIILKKSHKYLQKQTLSFLLTFTINGEVKKHKET